MALGAARDIAGRVDLPLPAWLFVVAAVLVLLVSFAALAAFWTTPRLARTTSARRSRPVVVDVVLGVLGLGVFALTVLGGLVGSPAPSANLAPGVVYVVVWVGLVAICVLVGDVFSLLSPWRSIARFAAWSAGRAGVRVGSPRNLPEWLGCWPAALGLLAFAWLEVAYSGAADPRLTAVLCVVYAGVQLVGMAVYGIEAWTRQADALGAYFGLLGRCAPLDLTGRALEPRRPLSGMADAPALGGLMVVACVPIAATTFDAFTATSQWQKGAEPWLVSFAFDRGAALPLARDLAATATLMAALILVVAVYELAVKAMRLTSHGLGSRDLGRKLAVSLAPIAAAYVVANGLTLLLNQGQTVVALASDPLGRGDDLFGTAAWRTNFALLGPAAVWYVQVAVLLLGHLLGLVLAHDRLLSDVADATRARRMQSWMLGAMVAYTTLALALLAALSA